MSAREAALQKAVQELEKRLHEAQLDNERLESDLVAARAQIAEREQQISQVLDSCDVQYSTIHTIHRVCSGECFLCELLREKEGIDTESTCVVSGFTFIVPHSRNALVCNEY